MAHVSIPHRAATTGARAKIVDAPGDSEAAPATPCIFLLRMIVHFCRHCYPLSLHSCCTFGGCMLIRERKGLYVSVVPWLVTAPLSLAAIYHRILDLKSEYCSSNIFSPCDENLRESSKNDKFFTPTQL
jgi:hypothetical protein